MNLKSSILEFVHDIDISWLPKDLKLKKIYDFISAYTKIDLSLINKNFIRRSNYN